MDRIPDCKSFEKESFQNLVVKQSNLLRIKLLNRIIERNNSSNKEKIYIFVAVISD